MSKYGMDKCPHCGGTIFRVRQHISGYGEFYGSLDGEEVDNSSLHDFLQYRTINKYAYCADCGKRMFKIEPWMELE